MSETPCPICGASKERLAQHWARSSCGYPSIPDELQAVVDGLVLAGATVAGNGSNRHLTIGTTSDRLTSWTSETLDWLCHSVRTEDQCGEHEQIYRIQTPAHPNLNRYERWRHAGKNSGRIPSGDYRLSPTAGGVWWAYAGGLEWSGPYDSQRQGTFSAANSSKRAWIVRVIEDIGLDPTPGDRRVKLSPSTLREWIDWIGEAIPGARHKWADNRDSYGILRDDPGIVERRNAALREAAKECGEPLHKENYREWSLSEEDAPPATTIVHCWGWAASCLEVGVSPGKIGKGQTFDNLIDALVRIHDESGDWPTTVSYSDHRQSHEPSLSWFYTKSPEEICGWGDAIERAKARER